ncbi:MAG: cysteine--tRNA ligase [Candidatus Kerfeldbacteria bacterium]|nr:cysteine--tRNA ligase [Candidatus Kerfeldbacteria bacterium]
MKLYNSLSRHSEEFTPAGKTVSLYTCGPTVYDFAHIGNLRTYIFEDVLKRALKFSGYSVKHVMNITDVGHLTDDADAGEDKMEKGARREKKTVWDIAQMYTDAFFRDIKALNILLSDETPRATKYIPEQIAMIHELEAKGHTYRTSDGVYFDTSTFPDYGKMARLDIKGQQEGARVEKNTEKRNATDFALWKFSLSGEQRAMEWESPWGKGFPGWHIECSAMARALLGDQIDIHCGGVDHMPVHHTNEIAQSESATGKSPFARVWMHGEFLLINDGRMGKSVGNFVTLKDLEEKGFKALAYRYFVLTAHYRSKLNFTWEDLKKARAEYRNLKYAVERMMREDIAQGIVVGESSADTNQITVIKYAYKSNTDQISQQYMDEFTEAISDDLNTPLALQVVWKLLASNESNQIKLQTLWKMNEVFGLDLKTRGDFSKEVMSAKKNQAESFKKERVEAKKQKDFVKADALKKEIESLGYFVEDTKDGSILIEKD